MCKASDAAMAILKKSLTLVVEKNTDEYYMDFVKLHKLLFLAQCYMLALYEKPLFEENIYAHCCGPYIDGIGFVPAKYGFSEIKDLPDSEQTIYYPLSIIREEAVDAVLAQYGKLNTDQIVKTIKEMPTYQRYAKDCDKKPIILHDDMAKIGHSLFENSFSS